MARKKKIFYPLWKTGKVYRPINYGALSVVTSYDEFKSAGMLYENIYTQFNDAQSLVDAWKKLPNDCWLITWSADFMPAILFNCLGQFGCEYIGEEINYVPIKFRRKQIHIIDVSCFFGVGLDALCRTIGFTPSADIIRWNDNGMGEYLRERTKAIYAIYDRYEAILKNYWNVAPSKSPGTTALKIFQTTLEVPIKATSKRAARIARNSVKGSALHWKTGVFNGCYMYDINASYPYAMRVEYPIATQMFSKNEPIDPFWIATVRLNYRSNLPFSPLRIPALDGNHYSPVKAMDLQTTINYIDYEILKSTGEVEITDWIEGLSWCKEQTRKVFSEWSLKLEEIALSDRVAKELMKVITRALHAKFNQSSKPVVGIVKKVTREQFRKLDNVADFFPLADGGLGVLIQRHPMKSFKPYHKPEYESITLAVGRTLIYSIIDENTIYVDTDCIISTKPRDDLSIGDNFGQWKLQHTGSVAIAGPRMYSFKHVIKAAGIATDDRHELEKAIWRAADGVPTTLKTFEKTSIVDHKSKESSDLFTIRPIVYPYVETIGNTAFVTQSPTREVDILKVGKILT